MKFPFGPKDDPFTQLEEFTYEAVKGEECHAVICKNICDTIISTSAPNVLFLPVCIPCYNEDMIELMKVVSSVMENMEFMLRKVCICCI